MADTAEAAAAVTVVTAAAAKATATVRATVAEKVTGAIKTYSTKDEYVNVDGTKYKFTATFDGVKTDYDKDTTYDVYTTKNGQALAIVGVDDASLDDVYYVIGV